MCGDGGDVLGCFFFQKIAKLMLYLIIVIISFFSKLNHNSFLFFNYKIQCELLYTNNTKECICNHLFIIGIYLSYFSLYLFSQGIATFFFFLLFQIKFKLTRVPFLYPFPFICTSVKFIPIFASTILAGL